MSHTGTIYEHRFIDLTDIEQYDLDTYTCTRTTFIDRLSYEISNSFNTFRIMKVHNYY